MISIKNKIAKGRIATPESIEQAKKMFFDFICLTGNPGTGVGNEQIAQTISVTKQNFSGLIIAGKMYSSGVDEAVIDEKQ